MQLYTFFRSGTSHRVRIALKLKGLHADQVPINLARDEQLDAPYARINPQKLVPALEVNNKIFIQSPSIIEWLEEMYPEPPLLPVDSDGRARVRALASIIACDIHPINNRRILQYLRQQFGANEDAINHWCHQWIGDGFAAYEALLEDKKQRGSFSYGDTPTLADVYLVPQVESARRFKVDMTRFPLIAAIEKACMELSAFAESAPMAQADAPIR
jgi:maleylpyruvate isomerase